LPAKVITTTQVLEVAARQVLLPNMLIEEFNKALTDKVMFEDLNNLREAFRLEVEVPSSITELTKYQSRHIQRKFEEGGWVVIPGTIRIEDGVAIIAFQGLLVQGL